MPFWYTLHFSTNRLTSINESGLQPGDTHNGTQTWAIWSYDIVRAWKLQLRIYNALGVVLEATADSLGGFECVLEGFLFILEASLSPE